MNRQLLFVLILFVLACTSTLWAQGFKYPTPPDSIRNRQGRIDYMTDNFWNSETISDTSNFKSPKLLLDYLYLLRQQDDNVKSIETFISLAAKSENTFGTILYWLDNILKFPTFWNSLYLLGFQKGVFSESPYPWAFNTCLTDVKQLFLFVRL